MSSTRSLHEQQRLQYVMTSLQLLKYTRFLYHECAWEKKKHTAHTRTDIHTRSHHPSDSLSQFPDEGEVLVMPGIPFRIVKVEDGNRT
jgi:hypothetical protein